MNRIDFLKTVGAGLVGIPLAGLANEELVYQPPRWWPGCDGVTPKSKYSRIVWVGPYHVEVAKNGQDDLMVQSIILKSGEHLELPIVRKFEGQRYVPQVGHYFIRSGQMLGAR